MKIANITATIMTVAIIFVALNPTNAAVTGISASAQTGFSCPPVRKGGTPTERAAIRKLIPSGSALEDPAQLNASVKGLKRLGLSKVWVTDHLIGRHWRPLSPSAVRSPAWPVACRDHLRPTRQRDCPSPANNEASD
jgi:hypothetical protein